MVVVRNDQLTSKGPLLHELFNDFMMNKTLHLLPAYVVSTLSSQILFLYYHCRDCFHLQVGSEP